MSIVSRKDPSWIGCLKFDRENIAGKHNQVAEKLNDKIKNCDVNRFVSASICPRDTNINDTKSAFYTSYQKYLSCANEK